MSMFVALNAPRRALLAACLLTTLLAGCGSFDKGKVYAAQEKFASGETYSRLFDATPPKVCRSAKLALMSQGYLVNSTQTTVVEGRKHFQPDPGSNLEIIIRVECITDAPDGKVSLAFAAAIQDTYVVKRSTNSASLGVGGIGSVSMPFSESSDGLTKVASVTITNSDFYDRLFDLIKQYAAAEDPAATVVDTPASSAH
ncbi:DUF2242 domain-containing protein [Aquabacterium sp.]|uniref:DUF2242 domain-containing protein n=1 Tax=Aquabacterium sp. TaxID=1872578 RepID=UPI0035B30A5C